jgi:hypothetical protein
LPLLLSYSDAGGVKSKVWGLVLSTRTNLRKLVNGLRDSFDSSQCAYGDAIANKFDYFYVCPLFIRHRIQLFNSLRKFQDVFNLDILLKGSPILTVEENTEIFDAVHHFITGSRRFT